MQRVKLIAVLGIIIFALFLPILQGIFALIKSLLSTIAIPLGGFLVAAGVIYLSYRVYLHLYFNGKDFNEKKESIGVHTKNCNELNDHIERLKSKHRSISAYDYGEGRLYDNSNFKFKRKGWVGAQKNNKIHNCSASVCKNASDQPFKYLCKYFDVKVDEDTLTSFEDTLNDFSAAEQGKVLLQDEKNLILNSVSRFIPKIIMWFSKDRLIKELGFSPIDLSDLYFPVYTFQYVSAGGNSSIRFDLQLNTKNLEKFIDYLGALVKFRKSTAGQRALMTSNLREKIKRRDNFECKLCCLSVRDERNLLLEIDHIIPISRGGITSEDNLQTLCWKCNRSKGARVL